MSFSPNSIDAAVYTALAQATALTSLLAGGTANPSVFQHLAPENQNPPYVVYSKSSNVPRYVFTRVAYESAMYMVKAVVLDASSKVAGDIAEQIDAALHDRNLTIAGHVFMSCRRESDIDFPEPAPGGQQYRHRGAMYRIQATPN